MGMLSKFLGGQAPLFHAMSGANARGLLKTPRVLTSTEGMARGLVDNIEAGATFGRHSVRGFSESALKPYLGNSRAVFRVRDLVKSVLREHAPDTPKNLIAMSPARTLNNMRYGGPVADYAQASMLSNLIGGVRAGKNWGNLSFSLEKPWRAYGDFGIMTTPSRVQGAVTRRRGTKEVFASPTWLSTKSGLPHAVRLPTAPGKIFYYPTLGNAPLARQLQQLYGRHNVIPWSNRTEARLKKMKLRAPDSEDFAKAEAGNLVHSELSAKVPTYQADHARTRSKVLSWLEGE